VLAGLPADYPLPILIVQHIGPESLMSFVRWLDREVAVPVRVARDGIVAGPGAWVAPIGRHMRLLGSMRLSLDPQRGTETYQPSVDVLLESMASSVGRRAVGVVLSGMGSDGARGVSALASAGALTLAQDEPSSVVFGMPKAAAAHGARTLTADAIVEVLRSVRPAGAIR
jgi:two-component system chemotaxis response regulator CheB